jgi:ubiquitin carboxyl-terminal hydrolase 34
MNESIHGPGLGTMRYNKVWNAYMLFYQRVSSMEKVRSVYNASTTNFPVTIPLPVETHNRIAMENELFIRTFCLLDPSHAFFVRNLLEQARRTAATGDSKSMRMQKLAVFVALDNFEQIISRSKELPELENLLVDLARTINDKPEAAGWIFQWTMKRPNGIRNLLLRNPQIRVREGFCQLLITAFVSLRRRLSEESLDSNEAAEKREEFTSSLIHVVSTLDHLWSVMHVHSRSWDNYFELILGIARLGTNEVEYLLHHQFFLRCLEMVWLDRDDMKKLKRHYINYCRAIEKGRKYSHFKMMEVLYTFLTHIDLDLALVQERQERERQGDKFCLSLLESDLVLSLGNQGELLLLKKILEQQNNPVASRKITRVLVCSESTIGLAESICRTLEEGLRAEPATLSTPFLDATLTFCQYSSDADKVVALIDYAAKGVESINDSAGREHVYFFQNLVTLRNERIPQEDLWFWTLVFERIPDWAPTLLHYPERLVRSLTLEFLQQLLFSKGLEDTSDDLRQFYRKIGRELGRACVDRLQRVYIQPASAQVHVDSRTVQPIMNVITYVVENYYDDEAEEDIPFIQQANGI